MSESIASLWLGREILVMQSDGTATSGRMTHVNSRRVYVADHADPPRVQPVVLADIADISAPLARG
jgi:hypothetical protein